MPLVVLPPWKRLEEHARLRPFLPSDDRGGELFCERCGALWVAGWDQYGAMYIVEPIDAPYAVLFETPPPSLARVRPVLARSGYARFLVTEFFRRTRVDTTDAARLIVEALGARDLTYYVASSLLDDLLAVFDNARTLGSASPAIRLDDARPLVDLLGRDDLYGESGNPAGARAGLREKVTRVARWMFGSAFDPDVADFVATPRRDRDQLLRVIGHTPVVRRSPAPRVPPEPRPSEVENIEGIVAALRARFANASHQPTPQEVQILITTLADLERRAAREPDDERRIAWLIAECRQLLQALHDAGRAAAREPARPAASSARPWTLMESLGVFVLPVIGVVATLVAGLLIGELAIPDGDWRATAFIAVGLMVALGASLRLFRVRTLQLAVGFGALVGLGTLGTAHWIAYSWDATSWAVAHYERRGENVTGVDREALRTRLIRDILRDPNASGGMWTMLRARAAAGIEVKYYVRGGPVVQQRGALVLWIGWIGEIVIVMTATLFGGFAGGALAERARDA